MKILENAVRRSVGIETRGKRAMFKVGKEFHLLHVVSDLDVVDGWYDEVFAVRRFVRNTMKAAMRKASLGIDR